MCEAKPPELDAQGHVQPAYLIPLWTWLAVLTVTIAVFFHSASQGAPWQLDFGLTWTDQAALRGQLAGLWGVPFLGLAAVVLYRLTLIWMQRTYLQVRPQSWWDRLPAPVLWQFPSRDPVARKLRLGVWLLVLVVVPFSLGHLARKHFQLTVYEACAEPILPGCKLMKKGPQRAEGKDDQREDALFRDFQHDNGWQRFLLHIAPQHLRTPGYFDHRFHVGAPSHLTYFPGLQPWVYIGLIIWVYWLWLRILLSVAFGRVVLGDLGTSVRRSILVFRFRTADATKLPLQLPPPALRIGVIGHRELDEASTKHVRIQLAAALKQCRRDGYRLRIVTGMAAGTDRLAVQWALDQIGPKNPDAARTDVELLALLPGVAADFRDHSSVDDRDAFNTQLTRIDELKAGGQVCRLELGGYFARHVDPAVEEESNVQRWKALKDAEAEIDAPARANRIGAHRHKADLLLRQCEFLIAVMKLSDSGKPGGTRECVEEALALNTPVLVIDSDSNNCALVTRVDQLRPDGLPKPKESGIADFLAQINSQLPELDQNGAPKNLGLLSRVYRPASAPESNRFAPWWTFFQAWFADEHGPKPSKTVVDAHIAAQAAAKLRAQESAPQKPSVAQPKFDSIRRPIADDQGAIMAGYRGGFVLAYGLGLLAVALALLIVLLLVLAAPLSKAELGVVTALTLLKLFVVLGIARIIHTLGPHGGHAGSSNKSKHAGNATQHGDSHTSRGPTVNDIAVALRYVSERLRIMGTMSALGCARMDLLHQSQRIGEPARVAEDLCRRLTLADIEQELDQSPSAHKAMERLKKVQDEQVKFNSNNEVKNARIHHRLERIVEVASRALIWIIALDLVVLALKFAEKFDWLASMPALNSIGLILVVLTALLPAVMATCNALIFQTQCEQLAERQRELADIFRKQVEAREQLDKQIQAGQVAVPIAAAVLIEAERTATVLAEEVAEWAVMSRQQAKEV